MKLLNLMLPLALSIASLTANAEVFKSEQFTPCNYPALSSSNQEQKAKQDVIAKCIAANFSYELCTSVNIHITTDVLNDCMPRPYESRTLVTAYLQVGKPACQ